MADDTELETPETPLDGEVSPPEPTAEELATQELEGRARRMGWRPESEYNGPKSRWVDAAAFIAKGENELPVLRDNLRTMNSRFARTEANLTEALGKIKDQSEVMVELRDMSRNAAKHAYDRAMQDIQVRERNAVVQADSAAYDQIQNEKRQIEAERPTEPKAAPAAQPAPVPQDAAVIQQWVAENASWWHTDMEMQNVATGIHGAKRNANPAQPLSDNLAEVKQRIMELYPHKFETRRTNTPSKVAAPSGGSSSRPKSKTVKDLGPEAVAAYEKFKRQMPDYTEAEYIKLYEAS